jgi:hypothetical protein
VGILQHTKVYKDTNSRLKRLAAEATINLHYKRGVIKQLVADDLEKKTRKIALDETRKVVADMFEQQKALNATMSAAAAAGRRRGDPQPSTAFAEKLKEERKNELKEVAQSRAGSVAELKSRFKADTGRSVKFSNPTTSAWSDPKPDEKEAVTVIVNAAVPQPQIAKPPAVPAVAEADEAAATIDTVISISDSGFHTPGYVEEEAPMHTESSDQTKPSQ